MNIVAILLVIVSYFMGVSVVFAAVSTMTNVSWFLHNLACIDGNGARQLGMLHGAVWPFRAETGKISRTEGVYYVPGVACFVKTDAPRKGAADVGALRTLVVVNAVVIGAVISKFAKVEFVNSIFVDKLTIVSFFALISDVVLADGLISFPATVCFHVCIYSYFIANECVELFRVLRSKAGLQSVIHDKSSKKLSLMESINDAIVRHTPLVSATKHQATQFLIRRAGMAGAYNAKEECFELTTEKDCFRSDTFAVTCPVFLGNYQSYYSQEGFDRLRFWTPGIAFTESNEPAPVTDCIEESAFDEDGPNIMALYDDESPHVSLVSGLHFFVTKPSPKLVTARVNTSIVAMCRSNPYPINAIPVVRNNWIYKQNVILLCAQNLSYTSFAASSVDQLLASLAEKSGNASLKRCIEEELQSELPCPGKIGKGVSRLPEPLSTNSSEGPLVFSVSCDTGQADDQRGYIDLQPAQVFHVEQPRSGQEKVIPFVPFTARDNVVSFLDVL